MVAADGYDGLSRHANGASGGQMMIDQKCRAKFLMGEMKGGNCRCDRDD